VQGSYPARLAHARSGIILASFSDMAYTVSDHILDRLTEWGISRIYGYPGDGINGLLGALDRAGERIKFVQSRHEELSAFMACAQILQQAGTAMVAQANQLPQQVLQLLRN
jgi:glyoxylate carboligase